MEFGDLKKIVGNNGLEPKWRQNRHLVNQQMIVSEDVKSGIYTKREGTTHERHLEFSHPFADWMIDQPPLPREQKNAVLEKC